MKLRRTALKIVLPGMLLWLAGQFFILPYFALATPSASLVSSWGTRGDAYILVADDFAFNPVNNKMYIRGIDGNVHVFDSNNNFETSFSVGNNNHTRIAISPSGTLYAVSGDTIRLYDTSYNLVSTFGSTGTGNGQFRQIVGIEYSTVDNHLYVLDGLNKNVQAFDAAGNFLYKWGTSGGGDGQFFSPQGLAISPIDGTLYAIDYAAGGAGIRIEAFNPADGTYLFKFGGDGTGDGQFSSVPTHIAIDMNGRIYVTDVSLARVTVFDASGNFLLKFGSSGNGDGQFGSMFGVGVDASGNVYVGNNSGRKSSLEIFNTAGAYQSKIVYQYMPPETQFSYAEGMTVDANGNIYLADTSNTRIIEFDASGNPIRSWGSVGSGPGKFDYPMAITVSPLNGNVYVADDLNNVQIFDSTGNYVSQFGSAGSGNGQLNYPEGITAGTDGTIYVADSNNNRVEVFDAAGTYLRQWNTGNGISLSYPTAIAFSSANNHLYVFDSGNTRVAEFDTNGTYITSWGSSGSGNGEFSYAEGISIDAAGNVFVADSNSSRIQAFDKDGNFITVWGSSDAGDMYLSYPTTLAAYGSYVYVAHGNGEIKKFTIDLSALPPVITSPTENSSIAKPFSTVSGTAENGASITVTENGNPICAATADGSGNWTCTLSSPSEQLGSHTISATQTDTSGNVSGATVRTFNVVARTNRSGSVPTSGGSSSFDHNTVVQPTVPATPTTPAATPPIPNTNVCSANYFGQKLHFGSRGEEVKKVQQFLKDKGYFFGRITGFYGIWTELSVKDFQQAHSNEILIPLKLTKPTGNWSYATIGLANNLLCQ